MELHFLKTTWSDIVILKNGNIVAMIDTGFEKQYETIKEYLDKMGIEKIEFILLTHFHRDHYLVLLKIMLLIKFILKIIVLWIKLLRGGPLLMMNID